MVKVATWVPDDLAERVRRAAEKDDRSVSQWLRLLLERELAGPGPLPNIDTKRSPVGLNVDTARRPERLCPPHNWKGKRPGAGGLLVHDCSRCGASELA